MSDVEKYKNLVLGSGGAGKCAAWTMGQAGRRTALVEGGALGSTCPNVACLPRKTSFSPRRSAHWPGEAPNLDSRWMRWVSI
jgi:pyruvate/2-oxoglutarate dehydrogenase complex dihydrolipoamide dehydrogenase (E3) component